MTITVSLPYYGRAQEGALLGIIAGGNFSPEEIEVRERRAVETPFGEPSDRFAIGSLRGREVIFLPRHGSRGIPPHRINHRANIYAFKRLEVTKVVGVNSVGSLSEDVSPGWVVIPHDYLSPWSIMTFYEHQAMHVTPALDEGLRKCLIRAAERTGVDFVSRGIYVQTIGPRLETRAEIAMLRGFGDLVGMTMAHEATLCQEMGLAYASICSVDNYCHGIGAHPLTEEEISRGARENASRVQRVLYTMMEEMG